MIIVNQKFFVMYIAEFVLGTIMNKTLYLENITDTLNLGFNELNFYELLPYLYDLFSYKFFM